MKYWVAAYYGPGGRKGGKGRPHEREGDLIIKVSNLSEDARQMEIDALNKREDVGIIHTWEEEK